MAFSDPPADQRPRYDEVGFRNVVTGEFRPITGEFRDLERLTCTPSFCVGRSAQNRLVVAHLDGSDQTVLPKGFDGPAPTVFPAGEGGLIAGADGVLDPMTGAYGTWSTTGVRACGITRLPDYGVPAFAVKRSPECHDSTFVDLYYVRTD